MQTPPSLIIYALIVYIVSFSVLYIFYLRRKHLTGDQTTAEIDNIIFFTYQSYRGAYFSKFKMPHQLIRSHLGDTEFLHILRKSELQHFIPSYKLPDDFTEDEYKSFLLVVCPHCNETTLLFNRGGNSILWYEEFCINANCCYKNFDLGEAEKLNAQIKNLNSNGI